MWLQTVDVVTEIGVKDMDDTLVRLFEYPCEYELFMMKFYVLHHPCDELYKFHGMQFLDAAP